MATPRKSRAAPSARKTAKPASRPKHAAAAKRAKPAQRKPAPPAAKTVPGARATAAKPKRGTAAVPAGAGGKSRPPGRGVARPASPPPPVRPLSCSPWTPGPGRPPGTRDL